MDTYSKTEKQILTQLQRGIEITSLPFQTSEMLEVLNKAQADGLVRRFGGVFDARRLGYKSILCALDVPKEQIKEKAVIIAAHSGVTHCYERVPVGDGHYPNLWFTLAALHDEFDAEITSLNSSLASCHSPLLQLPALRRFKIDVVFDLTGNESMARTSVVPESGTPDFSEDEKKLVRAMDQKIPMVERPFKAVAEQIGQSEEFVLQTLRAWKELGMLRRIGAILYHREAGFTANAMCVWPVDGDIAAAGHCVAARSEVTHCYQRPRLDAFPFDLYAMIHAADREKIRDLFKGISSACGLSGGELFVSGREFKKTSMQYFR